MKTPKILILATIIAALLSSCNDGTITTPQRSWSAMESPTNKTLNGLFFINETNGWAVGSDIMLFTSDGETWQANNINDENNYNFFDVHFFDTDNGVVCGENTSGDGVIFYTRNGGTSWNQADVEGSQPGSFSQMDFSDDNTGFAVGGGLLWKTTNGGASWQQLSSYTENAFALDAVGNNIWVGRSIIQFSADGGENWINQNVNIGNKLVSSLFFIDENNGFAGTSYGGGEIYRTVDGGQDWEMVFSGENFVPDMYFITKTKGWAIHSSKLLYTNDGNNWSESGYESDNYLNALYFPNESTGYAVGFNGTILKYQ